MAAHKNACQRWVHQTQHSKFIPVERTYFPYKNARLKEKLFTTQRILKKLLFLRFKQNFLLGIL